MTTHKHHIIPKHMGGTDNPNNIVEVSVLKHAKLHEQLYNEFHMWQDYVAWQGLLKNIDNQTIIKMKQSLGGQLGGKKRKGSKFSLEHKEKLSKAKLGMTSNMKGKKHTPETIIKMSKPKTESHAANISKSKKGVTRTPEQKENYRLAAIKRWETIKNNKNKGGIAK